MYMYVIKEENGKLQLNLIEDLNLYAGNNMDDFIADGIWGSVWRLCPF